MHTTIMATDTTCKRREPSTVARAKYLILLIWLPDRWTVCSKIVILMYLYVGRRRSMSSLQYQSNLVSLEPSYCWKANHNHDIVEPWWRGKKDPNVGGQPWNRTQGRERNQTTETNPDSGYITNSYPRTLISYHYLNTNKIANWRKRPRTTDPIASHGKIWN